MSYLLTMFWSNGYNCNCCRNSWQDEHYVSTLEEVALKIDEALEQNEKGSNREYESFSVIHNPSPLSADESDDLGRLINHFTMTRKQRKEDAELRAKDLAELESLKKEIKRLESKLERNLSLYKDEAIQMITDQIAEFKLKLSRRNSNGE